MDTMRLIVASVSTQNVFERFAQLSKKDKDAVVTKVKEKVNGKGKSNGKNGKKPKKGEVPPQLQKGKKKKDEEKAPAEEEVVEEEVVEEKKPVEGDKTEGAPDSKGLDNLVGDLAEEIEVIKSDGQVAPSEVMGLVDNVVKMVHVLLQAKPGKTKKASRELDIAEKIANESIEIDV